MTMRSVYKLSVLTILILTLSAFGPSHRKVVDRTMSSVVRITGTKDMDTMFGPMRASYVCTGFVINKHRVMTAAHCVGEAMTADGIAVKVLKADETTDLALLDVDTNKPALAFQDRPLERGDALTALGYGFGWTRILVLEVKVLLVDYTPPGTDLAAGMFVDGGYIGGMSGGPVVDANGKVVSIVQRSVEKAGYGVGTLMMKAFLLGTD